MVQLKPVIIIFATVFIVSGCRLFPAGQSFPEKNTGHGQGDNKSKSRQQEIKEPSASFQPVPIAVAETTEQAREKEAALSVLKAYLEAVMTGGNVTNWDLSTEVFRQAVLKDFPSEEKTKEKFVEYLREGIAHERLTGYAIKEITTYPASALIIVSAERSDIAGHAYLTTDTFKLVKEGDQWKVDGTFKPF